MQFTIESRELTTNDPRPARSSPTSITVNAETPSDAISQFLEQSHAELVSFQTPAECRESIATVRREDTVFLVRVYTA